MYHGRTHIIAQNSFQVRIISNISYNSPRYVKSNVATQIYADAILMQFYILFF